MIANKQTATMRDWVAVPNKDAPLFFLGTVTGHPNQSEFHGDVQKTSSVVFFDKDNGRLETRNTIYRLEGPSAADNQE